MAYLEDHRARRQDPRTLLEGARTALVVALPYYQGDKLQRGGSPRVAQYARLRDYHKLLWRRGEAVLAELLRAFDPKAVGRVVVDSAPVLERALAARAGAGFIGKNTCFIHPRKGSFFLLAEILTSLALPGAAPVSEVAAPSGRGAEGGCGTCRRCQVHCPTGALDEAYTLDANRCLAYWTIEHRGTIPERFWPWLKQYVFGCDICQLVCPYNRETHGALPRADASLVRVSATPDLYAMATMTQAEYEAAFGGTPLTRAKRGGLMRNALIAMKVSGDARLDAAMEKAAAVASDETVVAATIEQLRRSFE